MLGEDDTAFKANMKGVYKIRYLIIEYTRDSDEKNKEYDKITTVEYSVTVA